MATTSQGGRILRLTWQELSSGSSIEILSEYAPPHLDKHIQSSASLDIMLKAYCVSRPTIHTAVEFERHQGSVLEVDFMARAELSPQC
jgi:hypothetical protein